MIPVISPSATISATPCRAIVGDTAKAGATLVRLARSAMAISAAIASPGMPPSSASNTDSPSTIAKIRGPEKPSVFSTPISRVRSRIDSAIVLPTIIRMVTKAAPTTRNTISAMLPNCATNACPNAFSVSVEVSAGELAHIASHVVFVWVRGVWQNQPADGVLAETAGLVEIGVLEQEKVGIDVLDLALDDA